MCEATPAAEVVVVMDTTAGRRARRFLDEHWCTVHAAPARDHADLIVTELVTNAVRHGAPPVTLSLDCAEGDGVMISVTDTDPRAPELRDVPPDALGGRGVLLVDQLSKAWGVRTHAGGKTVWTQLVSP